jgi:WD40 repeat protein/energy-coupling factor transporter ATP-binding protein EcfA2
MPDQADYRYEVFVSFADGDRDWVEGYLLPALALPPERVITNQRTSSSESFQLGAAVVNEFERAVTGSRFTLLVLSRAYLTDQWSTFGEQLASYATVAEQRDRLVPLLRERNCPLPLRIDFRVRLDCAEQNNWESEIARLRGLLNQPEPKPERIPCPYPGMIPFREKDARFFYGREAEIRQMLQHFRNQRLLFVIGPSGCGKSSLVFAGLLPELQSSVLFDEGFWLVKQMRPGPRPVHELCAVLGGGANPNSESVAKVLASNSPAQRLLLAVDQFEELFSQAERSEQSGFIAAVKGLRAVESCALLITMRADFYPELMNSDLWGEVSNRRLEIAPLRGEALREAIEKPAGNVGVYLERALTDRLVTDAAEEPGALPLLQETMRLLWAEMTRRFLPIRAYEHLGVGSRSGLAVAIANKADATLNDLPTAEHKAIARRIFLRLVQFGDGRPDTRRQQLVSSLRSQRDDPELFEPTLRHLEENRLLTVTGEEGGSEKKVDLSHEAIITGWPQLQEWVKERREAEQTRRRLENKAEEWVRLGRVGGFLDRYELEEARRWLDDPLSKEIGFSSRLRELVEASAKVLEELERTEEVRLKEIAFAAEQRAEAERRRAEEERRRAEEERRLRLRSVALALASHAGQRIEDRERSLLMARQAHIFDVRSGGGVSDQVDLALRSALKQDDMLIPICDLFGKSISNLCLSPDGCLLIAAYTDQPPKDTFLYMWSLAKFEMISFPNTDTRRYCGYVHVFTSGIQALAFSGNSRLFAALDDLGEVWVFEVPERDTVPILTFRKGGFPKLDTTSYWARARPVRQSIRFVNEHEVVPDGDEYYSEVTRTVVDRHQLDLSRSFSVGGMTPQMNQIVASADGRYVCFEQHGRPGTGTHICKLDSPLPWTQSLGFARAITFSGDSRRVYVIADACRAWDLSSWPPVSIPCSFPESEAREHRLLASDRDRGTLACGLSNGKIWVWHTRPESTNTIVRELPGNCDTLAVCSDGSAVMAWLNGPAPTAENNLEHRPPKLVFSDLTELRIKTEKSQIEEAAYFLCGDYYRRNEWHPGSPDSVYFWRAAERLENILHTERKMFTEDHIVRRIVTLHSGGWAISKWSLEENERPVTVEALSTVEGLPLALGRADGGSYVASTDRSGVQVVKPDGTATLVLSFIVKDSTFAEYTRVLWAAFDSACRFLAVQTVESEGTRALHRVSLCNLQRVDAEPIQLAHSTELCTSIAFNSPATRLALGSIDRRLDRIGGTRDSRIARDARLVINGAILLYDLAHDHADPEMLAGPGGDVTALAFSRDRELLAGGGSNGKIVIYQLKQNLRPIYLEGHTAPIVSLTFVPKGFMLSASLDRTIRLWIVDIGVQADIAQMRISRNFSKDEWRYYVGEGIEYEKTCEDLPVGD